MWIRLVQNMTFNSWRRTCKIKITHLATGTAMTTGPATSLLVPGAFVRHPAQPDWGLGQVQSVVGNRITVNFENAGKLLINAEIVALVEVGADSTDS